jgi:hypothetical protein
MPSSDEGRAEYATERTWVCVRERTEARTHG